MEVSHQKVSFGDRVFQAVEWKEKLWEWKETAEPFRVCHLQDQTEHVSEGGKSCRVSAENHWGGALRGGREIME